MDKGGGEEGQDEMNRESSTESYTSPCVKYIASGKFKEGNGTPLSPQVHSLHLHLYSFQANRFIGTIFLDSIYMR